MLSEPHILTGGEDGNAANTANTVPDMYAPLMHFQEAGLLPDPNSVDMFKHNVEVAHQHVVRIQQSAQGIMAAMWVCQRIKALDADSSPPCRERAYQPNGNYTMQASGTLNALLLLFFLPLMQKAWVSGNHLS